MRTISSLGELEKALQERMQKALEATKSQAEVDMHEELGAYYASGEPGNGPFNYVRTGAMFDTPRTSPVSGGGNTASFEAYLDTSHRYTTGDYPGMEQVLMLANYGAPWTTKGGNPAHQTVGQKGFWERAQQKMEKTAISTFGQFFSK